MSDILKGLNSEQLQAVTTTEGYIRIIAGAGSGKTKALTHRYAYLVNELGIDTGGILCVTFTNKAAAEMKKRIRQLIGEKDFGLICTFHGFGLKVLKEDFSKVSYPQNFVVLDNSDTEEILSTVYKQSGISKQDITFKRAAEIICSKKYNEDYVNILAENSNTLYDLYQAADSIQNKVFYGYMYEQKKCYGFDFDDLLLAAIYIFEKYPDVLQKWQNRLEYIMVDEFQDVSKIQYRLCKMLSNVHKNLFVVGDPDQTIYSWRGAKIEYIIDFDKEFTGCKTVLMNKNYRCRPNIVDVSNSLISKNKMRIEKKLEATRTGGSKTIFNHLKTSKEEAEWVANTIAQLHESGAGYKDIAIFFRSHFISRQFEEALIKYKIPYIVHSGIGFYERAEIKTALSYLRMIDTADDFAFLRTINAPKRGLGSKKREQLEEYAQKNKCTLYQALKFFSDVKPFNSKSIKEYIDIIEELRSVKDETSISDMLKNILDKSGFEEMLRTQKEEDRLENIAELKQSIYEFEKNVVEDISLSDYLADIALYSRNDNETRKNSVSLMTIHAAKGLEFPYVFVCSLNEGIFPSSKIKDKYQMEEERRLCYVAFTRAKETLFISDSEGINVDNSVRYVSRFVFNVDKDLLEHKTELDEEWIKLSLSSIRDKENIFDNALLNTGDTVMHKVFGKGRIIGVNEANTAFIIQFENMPTPRTISKQSLTQKADT